MSQAVFDRFITEAQLEFLSKDEREECLQLVQDDTQSLLDQYNVRVGSRSLSEVDRPELQDLSEKYDCSNRAWELVITGEMVDHLSNAQRKELLESLSQTVMLICREYWLDWDFNSRDPKVREAARKAFLEFRD